VKPFEYHRPASLGEATALLAHHGDEARILAGGQSLLNMMKWRLAAPAVLVDINRLKEIAAVEDTAKGTKVGAMVRYGALSSVVPERYGAIHDALPLIADVQVRNLGTLGGSCCQADPFGDMPNVIVALEARMVARSAGAERTIGVDEFFTGPLQTALRPDEMLCHIELPPRGSRTGSAYEKFSWRKGDFAIVSIAANVVVDEGGRCRVCRLVAGGLGMGPVRLVKAGEAIVGHPNKASAVSAAAAAAADEAKPESDPIYGSSDYKRSLVRTLARRALERAWDRAQSGTEGGVQ
jgi:CO/xanthine dehydrogenase FAD-binding subunit